MVDEIIYTNPKRAMPDNFYESFRFRAMMPKTPGKILYFRSINVCEEGDDPYVDLPEEDLDIQDPDFKDKLWKFMTATRTPAPFLILRQPEKGSISVGMDAGTSAAAWRLLLPWKLPLKRLKWKRLLHRKKQTLGLSRA